MLKLPVSSVGMKTHFYFRFRGEKEDMPADLYLEEDQTIPGVYKAEITKKSEVLLLDSDKFII